MIDCANCASENLDEAKFCQNCGQPLARVCPSCSTHNAPTANFCLECGTALASAPPSPSPILGEGRGGWGERGEGQKANPLTALRESAPQDLQAKIRAARTQPEGQRKLVTILFSDIVGSTSLAEQLDPEEWKEVVSGAHRRVSAAVYRYEGTIAQLLGDGVLAFFGAPITHEDDPERAVRAALDIQAAMAEYRAQLTGYVEDFQVRIGLHTGEVVVGQIGDDLHMEYLALGDAVNLAARLQGAAEPGGVLISADTARLVRAVFELDALGEIALKGKGELVAVFAVAGLKAVPESSRGIAGLDTPFVGREAELGALVGALERLAAGHGGVVFIMGEAGIGKSRLMDEARRTLDDGRRVDRDPQPAVHWLEGRALSYGGNLSYWLIQQLLLDDLGLSDGDPAPRVRAALRKQVKSLFGEEGAQIEPYLAHLMGLQFAGSTDEQVQILDGETLKWQTKKALSAYFQQGAEDRPTVLVFEDLHWADPSSLEVLETLLSLIDRVPLLILSLMRPDREHASWHVRIKAETDYPHRYTDIHLQQLMADDASELVSRLLATPDLSPALRDKIFSRAEGNPLFLEEILRSLIDRELLVQENGAWRVTEEASVVTIPETLQGVLLARLDRLDEDVRRTLQMASVIGRSFLYRLLAAIGEAEIELDTHLTQLQRVDLVREKTRRPELEYIFKHALTQEAAYNSMLLERRRVFHRQVGEALETLFSDRQDDLLGLLAHHFDCAGDGNKAVEYLLAAGDKARLEDIYDVAIKFYQRAILLLDEVDDVEQSAQTWLKLGLIYHADFKFDEAHAAYETAFSLRSEANTKAQDPVPEKVSASSARYFRYSHPIFDFISLDPGQAYNLVEANLVNEIFAGIAEMDAELNVVPHAARSWEVLDGGRRYLIYLREDVYWTDGTLVTAEDYEWAWKRNLAPSHQGYNNKILDVVVGARDYREGRQDDPDQIGVHARNKFTLEVNLASPVAYFPYLLAHSITFPLRRAVVEQFGDRWWHPENIQSNGAFQLVSFEPGTKAICERNPRYFGDFPGNLERVTWEHIPDARERVDLFRQGKLEHITLIGEPIPSDLPKLNIKNTRLVTHFLVLFPKPPLDNLLVRQALIHALDRDSLSQTIRIIPPRGGLIPPGMPGHTPGLGLSYDPDLARRLLAEAGYPGGEGFPSLSGKRGIIIDEIQMSSQLQEVLGIEVVIESSDGQPILEDTDSLFISGWIADYPDPDSFLRDAFIALMQEQGWRDPEYDALVTQAARSNNRVRRMAMYRQADRHLVVEQALVVPLGHGLTQENYLVHPRVRYYPLSSIGSINHRQIIIDPEKSLPS